MQLLCRSKAAGGPATARKPERGGREPRAHTLLRVRAFVLGHWGDTHGRKNVLVLCMFMMGVSTFAVALLPGVCAALRALTGLLDEAGGDLGEVAG